MRVKLNIANKKRKGFTLAETLVTLVVIGVVAAIVIPTVIQNTQQAEYKTSFQKIYASFSQASLNIITANAGTMVGAYGNSDDLFNLYANQMSFVKTCPENTSPNVCFNGSSSLWYTLQGTAGWTSFTGASSGAQGILNNGMTVMIKDDTASACNSAAYTRNGSNLECGYIYIDVNGLKPPNRVGVDMFGFYITPYGTIPFGAPGSHVYGASTYCSISGNNMQNGNGCAALVLLNQAFSP